MSEYLSALSRAWGLLLFRGSLKSNRIIQVKTVSRFNAIMCKEIGFDIKYADYGILVSYGIVPVLLCESDAYFTAYMHAAKMVSFALGVEMPPLPFENPMRMFENFVKQWRRTLVQYRKATRDVIEQLEKDGRITTNKKTTGITPSEAAKRLQKAAEEVMTEKVVKNVDPIKHWSHGRSLYLMLNLLLRVRDPRILFYLAAFMSAWPFRLNPEVVELIYRELSEREFSQLLTVAIIVGGKVLNDGSILRLRNRQVKGKAPRYDAFHKAALWLALLTKYRDAFRKYGVDIIPSIHVSRDVVLLRFEEKAAKQIYTLGGQWVEEVYKKAESAIRDLGVWGRALRGDKSLVNAKKIVEMR